ncbi:MAG: integrase core domain-containing protein, partial [Acidimicrobiia bacterium]|nr:integrase core domain-containing protein [Acidimicrobiia bacterium]
GVTYASHHERAEALPHWLYHYNHHRPHSSIGGRPPISRVNNVCG